MTSVGIRELKAHFSQYLARVKRGERIIVSERGKPIASLSPADEASLDRRVHELVRRGLARWSGGKPRGLRRPVHLAGGSSLAETIISDRR
jgi:prevent-host-death family protein